jgi:hypothetical protein
MSVVSQGVIEDQDGRARARMPSKCVVYRFPDGGIEYRFVRKVPAPGDAVTRDGQVYVVKSIALDRNGNVVVALRFDEDDAVEAAWLRLH